MNEIELFTCDNCKKRFIERDINFLNDLPMCDICFKGIPEFKKKNMTCRIKGCKKLRRDDLGSEYCDFHLNERLFEINELYQELKKQNRNFRK